MWGLLPVQIVCQQDREVLTLEETMVQVPRCLQVM